MHAYMSVCVWSIGHWRDSNLMMMLGNKQSPWYQNYCTYMQLFTTFIDVVRFFLLACIVNHQSKHSISICAFAAPLLSTEIIYRVLILFWSLCLPKYLFEMKSQSLWCCLFTVVNLIFPDYQVHNKIIT